MDFIASLQSGRCDDVSLFAVEVARLGLRPPDVLPTTYLLAPDGEVVAKLIGMQTDAEIREQLVMKGALLDEGGD